MILNSDELESIAEWTTTAKPLTGIYYRNVEYRYMDPKEVLSDRGAAHYGGRFASVGAEPSIWPIGWRRFRGGARQKSDSVANAQITIDKYPRIVFGVSVWRERVLDFTKSGLSKRLVQIRQNCSPRTSSPHQWNSATCCVRNPSKGSSSEAP